MYTSEDYNTTVKRREREGKERRKMGAGSKVGDMAFKGFTATLGLATIYLTATFSVNCYRGISWHNAQSKLSKEESNDQNTTAA